MDNYNKEFISSNIKILKVTKGKIMESIIGKDVVRKEAYNKVAGAAKYSGDLFQRGVYHIELLTSPYAHATIINIDKTKANDAKGVKAIILGNEIDILCGTILEDRPPLARDKVRYFGEPVAMVIADSEQNAKAAVKFITVEYEVLPVVNSITDALKCNHVMIHDDIMKYSKAENDVYPEENSNICDRVKIRKGNMQQGWESSEVIVEGNFALPQSDHAAMETRTAQCEIMPNGKIMITASSQAPFSIKKQLSKYFNISEGDIVVNIPFVGGGFGGKASIHLEILAYIASSMVNGHAVIIASSRELDMVTSPCHLGLEAKIKLGADKNGKITAAEMLYQVDCGAYSDICPSMTKSIAVDCAGPYNMENISCDAVCIYTNHPYTTSFRGFGHASCTFCMERMMDKLAIELGIDPFDIRLVNALKEGDFTPTQTKVTLSNTGNLGACLEKLKTLINWDEGQRIEEENHLVRAKGIGCFCKTSDSPTDSVSGVFLNFNTDGSINLNCGAVEYGPGMKTTAAQILAEKMKMDISRIHVKMEVDTETSPTHWKTVASMTTFMVGRAVIRAAEDLIRQLKGLAATVMRCAPEDLDIEEEKVYLKSDPQFQLSFKSIVHGYKYQNGNAIEGQILGRGSYIMSHLTHLDKETGKGKAGPYWTLGAQAIEIEYDTVQHTYRLLKAATVVDAGKVINPKTAKGVLMGGMCMGIGYGTREEFIYDNNAIVQNTSFRTYKMMRYGETPDYLIDFVETPFLDAPYGARGLAEHGIIGISGAIANAISLAAQIDIKELPITPELIWRKRTGAQK